MCKKTKGFLRNLILLFASITLAIVFSEMVLRFILPKPIVWKFPQENYIYDPVIGHWLKPDQHAFTHDKLVITNSIGIRDTEHSLQPIPGIKRVLAIGDSQTFGNGLELSDTWPKQLETQLNLLNNDLHFEVINSGLPGSDTWQHEVILERMITNYRPDVVILAFYVNDVVKRFTPNPSLHESGDEFKFRVIYTIKQSVLLLTLREAFHTIRQILAPSTAHLRQKALLNGENEYDIIEAWRQVDDSISAMKKMTDTNNISFMIASLPRRDQIDGRLPWNAYNNHIQAIAEKYNIPFVSMLEPLQQGYKIHKRELFIPWDGHNSKIANNFIAQKISNILASALANKQEMQIP